MLNEKILEERNKKKFYNSTKEEKSKMLNEFFKEMDSVPSSSKRKVKYGTSIVAYILCLFAAILVLILCLTGIIK